MSGKALNAGEGEAAATEGAQEVSVDTLDKSLRGR